jgi:hypothetical protein
LSETPPCLHTGGALSLGHRQRLKVQLTYGRGDRWPSISGCSE